MVDLVRMVGIVRMPGQDVGIVGLVMRSRYGLPGQNANQDSWPS
jgi:hypothetical protein